VAVTGSLIPAREAKSSKRVVPKKASRRIRNADRVLTTSRAAAIEQRSAALASRGSRAPVMRTACFTW
jgi:hypothetical protein